MSAVAQFAWLCRSCCVFWVAGLFFLVVLFRGVVSGSGVDHVLLASRYANWDAWGKGKGAHVIYGSPLGGYEQPMRQAWVLVDPADLANTYEGVGGGPGFRDSRSIAFFRKVWAGAVVFR